MDVVWFCLLPRRFDSEDSEIRSHSHSHGCHISNPSSNIELLAHDIERAMVVGLQLCLSRDDWWKLSACGVVVMLCCRAMYVL